MSECCECRNEAIHFVYLDGDRGKLGYCERHWAHLNEKHCDDEACQDCCPHDDHDHGLCLDCEKDLTDEFIARAEAAAEAARDAEEVAADRRFDQQRDDKLTRKD